MKKRIRARALAIYLYCVAVYIRYKWLSFSSYFFPKKDWERKRSHFFQREGKRAKILFFRLGGIYIKLGQFLSNLFHILPEEFLWELQELQDKVPAHPFPEVEKRWNLHFSKKIHEVFDSFEPEAIASASIGQVHVGFFQGKKVAIKILYPGIEAEADQDLRTVKRVLYFFELLIFHISQKEVAEQLETMIREELNLKLEYSNLKKAKTFFQRELDFFIPEPISEFCTSTILVTEFVEGKRFKDLTIDQFKGKKNPYVDKLIKAYILMVFDYRFYHADPHPGNLILMDDGRLSFIDFGAVQEVTRTEAMLIERIVFNYMQRDYYDMAEAFYELGAVKDTMAKKDLVKILEHSMEKLRRLLFSVDNFRNISWEVLKPEEDLLFLKEIQFSIRDLMGFLRLPPRFLTLHRVLALLLGIVSQADPRRSLVDYAEKPFYSIVWKGTSRWRKKWQEEGEEILSRFLSFPKEAHEYFFRKNREDEPDISPFTHRGIILQEQLTYGVLGSLFFYFGNYYSEKPWKEVAILFFCVSGLSFFAFAKACLKSLKHK